MPFGKIIIWNNTLYFGNTSNVPTPISVDLSNYVTNTQLLSTLSPYTRYAQGTYTATGTLDIFDTRHIDLDFIPKIIYVQKQQLIGTAEKPLACFTFNVWYNSATNYRTNTYIWETPSSDYVTLGRNNTTYFDIGMSTGFNIGSRLDDGTRSYMYLAIG